MFAKFSPDNNLIAVGSHDNLIYVYRVALSVVYVMNLYTF